MSQFKIITLALAASLAFAPAANAASATFYMSGTCDGLDRPQDNPSQIVQYSDVVAYAAQRGLTISGPIYITGVQVRMMALQDAPGFRAQYILAGNSDEPDIMAWGDRCRDSTRICIGADGPAIVAPPMRFGQGHVDLHAPCVPVGAAWQAFYTIFYSTVAPGAP